MPDTYIKNVDTNLFIRSGIGLLLVAEKIVEEVIPAKKSATYEFIQKYLITSKIIEKYADVEKKHLRRSIFTPYTL